MTNTLGAIAATMMLWLVADAQIRIVRVDQVPLGTSYEWSHPQFSPEGSAIYYTTLDGNGIWEYSLRSRSSRQLTGDAKAGLAFALSPDGKRIVYRRTAQDTRSRVRRQEMVEMDLASRATTVLASGTDISAPSFSNNGPVYSVRREVKNLKKTQGGEITILGIENTKIALNKNGMKVLLDPLGNGSYVWPVLSPGKSLIVAYEMDRGAFVCDLDGRVISRIGKRDAPAWTRSGKWIVYMDDKDDGHQILSSDLWAVTPDGKSAVQLTATDNLVEMHPHCSPTENRIVCSTLSGAIYLMT
jgi:Tol biopolymer transport system component